MRTITAAQQAVLDSGVQAEHVRMWVKDIGGTFRDLTVYPGFNALKSVTWKQAITDPHASFDATLARELFKLSLATFVEGSALNRAFNPSAAYSPLVQAAREVKIEVAIVPLGTQPQSGDWMEVFRGRIDHVNSASGDDVTIGGRSLSGRLAQQYVKLERVYCFGAVGGVPVSMRVWSPEMVVVAGEYICPAARGEDDPGLNRFFKVAVGGTAGLVEPTWTAGTGIVDGATVRHDYVAAPTTTGFPVEEIMQLILRDNVGVGDSLVTLYTPMSPNWDILQYMQGRGFTWDALSGLVGQIGWDLRDKFDEASGTSKLTFYEPDRAASASMHTFAKGDHGKLEDCSVDVADVRNSVRGIYRDSSDVWPDGTPKRKVLDDSDPASRDKYLELWCEIQEDELANIDTEAEMQRLIDALLSDCAEPDVVIKVPLMRGFPWVELNDYDTFAANDLQYDTDKTLAITEVSQTFDGGRLKTSLGCRGKPTAGVRVHKEKMHHPNKPDKSTVHRLDHFQGAKTPALAFEDIVGGVKIKFGLTTDGKGTSLLEEYELHVSADPNFTPDDSTLAYVGAMRNVEVSQLIGGRDYYATVIPRFHNAGQLVRGQPSTKRLFTAGRANAGHLKQNVEWGRAPLNGGFETWNDTGTLPDHWHTFQTWGVNFERMVGSAGVSGDSWLRFNVKAIGIANIFTEHFTVEKNTDYELWWWANITTSGTAGSVKLLIVWFDSDDNFLDEEEVDVIAWDQGDMTPGTWYRRGGVVTAPEGARFASVQLKQGLNGDMVLDVDSVRFDRG